MAFLLTFLGLLLQILWLAILVRVILSWFPVDPSNPIIRIVWDVTEPILAPFRRVIPRITLPTLVVGGRVSVVPWNFTRSSV